MQIKKKADIDTILDNFSILADWDPSGEKLYFVFSDRKRGGQWTLMCYSGDRYSIHGMGEDYADEEELFLEDRDSVIAFLWENRAAFNNVVKQTLQRKLPSEAVGT